MNSKATIKDIQRETGLSLGTISKYLNGGTLKEVNAKLIEKAIEKLDYHVDPYARSMVTGKTNTVGIVIPELGNAFYGLVSSYLDHYLRKHNYEMVVKEYNNNPSREKKCINWFIDRKMDAIIVFSVCDKDNLSFYKNLSYKNIIFVDNKYDELDYDFVGINNYDISKEAVSYLIDNGHKNIIGLFMKDSYTSKERLRGFIDAYKEKNLELNTKNIFYLNDDLESVCKEIKNIITNKNITAIYASNYISTLGTIFIFNEYNINVPSDISLFGFDNIMLTNVFIPKITIVEQPLKKMAEVVIDRVVDINVNKPTKNIKTLLKCDIVKGDSIKTI